MQDDSEPNIRSQRLKQLIARRSSGSGTNSNFSSIYPDSLDSSTPYQPSICDITTSRRGSSVVGPYRPLPEVPSSSPKETDRNSLLGGLSRDRVEIGIFGNQTGRSDAVDWNNQAKMVYRMPGKENINNVSTAATSILYTKPQGNSTITFEGESPEYKPKENRPPYESSIRQNSGVFPDNSGYGQAKYSNEGQSGLIKQLVQPQLSPRQFLRESQKEFIYSAEKKRQNALDVSGEFLASPAMSEEDVYREGPLLVQNETDRSGRVLVSDRMLGSDRVRTSGMIPQGVEGVVCPEHAGNVIMYICKQDKCGRLLCPYCVQEHRRPNHQGVYETLQGMKHSLNVQLIQAKGMLENSANDIVQLQSKINKVNSELGERIDRIEEGMISSIRQYFEGIRREYNKEVQVEAEKSRQSLSVLREGIKKMVEKLDDDLQALLVCKDNSILSAQFLSKMVMGSYMSCSEEFNNAVGEVNSKVKQFMENQEKTIRRKNGISLQIDNNLEFRLNELLAKGVKLVMITPGTSSAPSSGSNSSRRPPIKEKEDTARSKQGKSVNQVQVNKKAPEPKKTYKQLEFKGPQTARSKSQGQPKHSRSLSLAQDPRSFEEEEEENSSNTGRTHTPQWKGKEDDKHIMSMLWEANEEAQETFEVPSINNYVEEKENGVPASSMRMMLRHMGSVYNSEKMKVIDDGFFEGLFNLTRSVNLADFKKKELWYDNVKEYVQIKVGKGRCLFSAFEKVFFVLNIDDREWMLIEVRRNPKCIIVYDFLGKLVNLECAQSIFDIVFKVIRWEYKTKLGQNVETHLWERRIALEPCLSVREPNDTGILALKMIANKFKGKSGLQGRISVEEINETRNMLEAIFNALENNQQGNSS